MIRETRTQVYNSLVEFANNNKMIVMDLIICTNENGKEDSNFVAFYNYATSPDFQRDEEDGYNPYDPEFHDLSVKVLETKSKQDLCFSEITFHQREGAPHLPTIVYKKDKGKFECEISKNAFILPHDTIATTLINQFCDQLNILLLKSVETTHDDQPLAPPAGNTASLGLSSMSSLFPAATTSDVQLLQPSVGVNTRL